jgi:hypothetical protein
VRQGLVFVSLLAACGRLGFTGHDPVDGPEVTPFSPTSNGCLEASAGPLAAVATFPTSTGGYGVWSAPPYLLEADTSGGLHALRFDGSTFTQTGTLPDLGWVEAVVSDGTYFYVGAPGTGFYVVDLLGDGSLQLAAQDLTITEARHAWFGNGNIYVPAGGNGLYALHFDGTTLAHLGTPTISMSWSQGTWATGSRVYLADADAFRILDFDGTAFTDVIPPKTDHPGTTRRRGGWPLRARVRRHELHDDRSRDDDRRDARRVRRRYVCLRERSDERAHRVSWLRVHCVVIAITSAHESS